MDLTRMDSIGLSEIRSNYIAGQARAGIRTLGTGVSPYNGLAIHKAFLIRLENFSLYFSFQRIPSQSI